MHPGTATVVMVGRRGPPTECPEPGGVVAQCLLQVGADVLGDVWWEWAALVYEGGGVLDEPRRSHEERFRHKDGGEVAVVVSGQDAEGG
ncbi:hypothetical protein, partial [Rhodococcus sp. LB1]|uniref:hypothetical protein n=1 Tax=Rhodococcus sp. LB1 TaxID=1807499 RepID=UPI0012E93547